MAVPKVNENFLRELEAMGFPRARATRALHYSGNTGVEEAVTWIVDHEKDPDIDQIPNVIDIGIDSDESFQLTEEVKRKAQMLRDRARNKKEEEEKSLEREREKVRFRTGKELINAKRLAEENERKCYLALKQSKKDDEKNVREKIRRKLEQDKLERRGKLAMPIKHPTVSKLSVPVVQENQDSQCVNLVSQADLKRECLRSLKRNHMDDDARVRRAFQTLLIYVGNVARNPDEEKFRKIRISNPLFHDRVGSLKGGVEFLELCGFERTECGTFLYLRRDNVNMTVLNSAGFELKSAITNPFFGVLSRKVDNVE